MDRSTVAYSATRVEVRRFAWIILLLAGVAMHALDKRGANASALVTSGIVHVVLSTLFAWLTGTVFRAFDKALSTTELFNVVALSHLWVLVGWPLGWWDASLPIDSLTRLLVFVSTVIAVSSLTGVRVVGVILGFLFSALAVGLLFLIVGAALVATLGVAVGMFFATEFEVADMLRFFNIEVETSAN
jgi:hypothetical protein